jgi:hypothetical protein
MMVAEITRCDENGADGGASQALGSKQAVLF